MMSYIFSLQAYLRVYPQVLRAWYHLGLAHFRLQNIPKAEAAFLYLLNKDQTHEKALLQLGLIYHTQGEYFKAAAYLRKLEEEHPHNIDGRHLLTDCYKRLQHMEA